MNFNKTEGLKLNDDLTEMQKPESSGAAFSTS